MIVLPQPSCHNRLKSLNSFSVSLLNVHERERSHTLARTGDLIVALNVEPSGSLASEISKGFEIIYLARLAVFKLKFGLKFVISALQSVAVFVLLFFGGIMVINGKTEIGIVVAFISGLDRVLEPWREMIAFVRSTSAARIQFRPDRGHLGEEIIKLPRGWLRRLIEQTGDSRSGVMPMEPRVLSKPDR